MEVTTTRFSIGIRTLGLDRSVSRKKKHTEKKNGEKVTNTQFPLASFGRVVFEKIKKNHYKKFVSQVSNLHI